jgi:hypothetical protein
MASARVHGLPRHCPQCGYPTARAAGVLCPECGAHLGLPPPYRRLGKFRAFGLWGLRASLVVGVAIPGVIGTIVAAGSGPLGAAELAAIVIACGVVLGIAGGVQLGVWLIWRWLHSCYKASGAMLENEQLLWVIAAFPWVCCVLSGLAWLMIAGLVNW